jgi:branched-chain amino acid transport system ATP-binding protein
MPTWERKSPLLKLTDISGKYGQVGVLFNVSMTVMDGQMVAVIGSNGAGKSTLINIICGTLKPTSGRIELDGQDITGFPAHVIAQKGISQVPEGRQVFAKMSVLENLLAAASYPRVKVDRDKSVQRVFEVFPQLKERREQKAGSLSGGEQQMLAIGRGLMSKPKLLILDELSQGLSPLITQEIFKILVALNKEGLTTLVVDQNLTQTLKTSDYGYVMENGRIVLEGTSQELLSNDKTRRAYLGM